MTVFCLRGSIIKTDLDGQITNVQSSVLDIVTRTGTNTLNVAYLGDEEDPMSVSLSDYNLLFDTVHINDANLPDHVEYFDLAPHAGQNIRVINFLFENTDGIEERMYWVGDTQLPVFRTPGEASLFFAEHAPQKITTDDGWTIQLTQISGVQTSGVFVDLEAFQSPLDIANDAFDFNNFAPAPDTHIWDIEFAQATQSQETMATQPDPTVVEGEAHDIDIEIATHLGEFSEG